MDIYRPERFEELYGNEATIRLFTNKIKSRSFPKFTIIVGNVGCGKTTLAGLAAMGLDCTHAGRPCYECPTCIKIRDNLIRQNINTQDVQKFKMSEEGGVPAAMEVVGLSNTFNIIGDSRILIMDEMHTMKKEAQEKLLDVGEHLPDKVYWIGTAKTLDGILPEILSRAVVFHLYPVDEVTLTKILKKEANRRGLLIENEMIYKIIASWSDCHPRKALKALEAMGTSCTVTLQDIKDYVTYLDIKKVIPIISSFTGSPLIGMKACMKFPTDINSHKYLLDFIIACIQVKANERKINLSVEDKAIVREAISNLDVRVLENFLLELSRLSHLDSRSLLAIYLNCHPSREEISTPNKDLLREEKNDKMLRNPVDNSLPVTNNNNAPPMVANLLLNASKLVD